MSKLFLAAALLGSLLLIGAGRHKTGAQRDQGEEARYKAEIVDATTPITPRVLSERQDAHSKLANDVSPIHRSILEAIAPYQGKHMVYGVSRHFNIPQQQPPIAPDEYFSWLARASDAIVRGIVMSKLSGISEDETFLFTDYEIFVNKVLRDSTGKIRKRDTITVTCPGGKVLIGSVIVKTGGNGSVLLPQDNQEVLLFLKALQGQSDYSLVRLSAFALDDKSVRSLGGRVPYNYLDRKKSFLETVQKASKQ